MSARKHGGDEKRSRATNSRATRLKKRKYRGLRKVKTDEIFLSTSAKKLRDGGDFVPEVKENFLYVMLEFYSFFSIVTTIVACRECGNDLSFKIDKQRGLGFKIHVSCGTCGSASINSSPYVRNGYEINTRISLVMRLLGIGRTGLKLFCGLMDMFPPVAQSYHVRINKKIKDACKTIADLIMKKASREENILTNATGLFQDENAVAVSVDGSWMKRGFTSLFGIVAVIGSLSSKVIDVTVLSAFCKQCHQWETKMNTPEYEEFLEDHWDQCSANHKGSSGSMEVNGAVSLFGRSLEERGLKYLHYIGDGDSKSHKAVSESMPYGTSDPVIKKECVGHVGKRMGTRLRNLVKKTPGLKGRGKLTGKEIDKLSSYYGNAIRSNSNSVDDMKIAIWATFYHRSSTDIMPQHHFCPAGPDSWCRYQRAMANNEEFHHKSTFSREIMDAMKPIYEDLTKTDLLVRCLGAHTQNNNESFNALVWQMSPKIRFNGNVVVEMSTYIATCIFNEGYNTLMAILDQLGITVGPFCKAECMDKDRIRI